MIRSYSEVKRLKTFEERYNYLRITGQLGIITFGFDRYLNQNFYHSTEWKRIRNVVIIRDNSCDLGILDRSVYARVRVHHMNPITVDEIKDDWALLLNPEFLICTSLETHNAIHFGTDKNLVHLPEERKKGDTTLWKVF